MRSTNPTRQAVETVWDRAGGACERCGRGLNPDDRGWGWSIHHRCARGAGGTRLAWVNEPANLVAICGSGVTGCHGWIEQNRALAYDTGWLIRRNAVGTLAADIPLPHFRYGYVRLTNDGGHEPAD